MKSFFLIVTLIASSHFAAANNNNNSSSNSLVGTACQKSRHKKSCAAALESDPNSRGADLKGLALIAIKLASANASDTAEHLKVLLDDESLDPAVQDGVSECLEHYLDAAEQLDDSVAALLSDSLKDVKTWVEVAITDANSCQSALGEEAPSVLGNKNEAFRRLCSYALAVNKLLEAKNN